MGNFQICRSWTGQAEKNFPRSIIFREINKYSIQKKLCTFGHSQYSQDNVWTQSVGGVRASMKNSNKISWKSVKLFWKQSLLHDRLSLSSKHYAQQSFGLSKSDFLVKDMNVLRVSFQPASLEDDIIPEVKGAYVVVLFNFLVSRCLQVEVRCIFSHQFSKTVHSPWFQSWYVQKNTIDDIDKLDGISNAAETLISGLPDVIENDSKTDTLI